MYLKNICQIHPNTPIKYKYKYKYFILWFFKYKYKYKYRYLRIWIQIQIRIWPQLCLVSSGEEEQSVHWGSETVYVPSPAKLHSVFEFQHSSWFPPPVAKQLLWHMGVETFNKVFAFVWTVLLVTLTVCVKCVCYLLKFQPELCFTWRILQFGNIRKLSKFTKWRTTSAILQW